MAQEERFQAAEQVYQDPLGDGYKNVEAALATLDPSEHEAFLVWSHAKHESDPKASIAAQRNLPRLSVARFMRSLHDLNVKNPSSTSDFLGLVNGRLYQPCAEPVPIGGEGNIEYFIHPGVATFDHQGDGNYENIQLHPTFDRFKSDIGATPLLEFGLHLGPIRYSSCSESSTEKLQKTPVHAFLNPVSSTTAEAFSIWLVLDHSMFEVSELDQDEDAWPWLGLRRGDRPAFDCMQLFTAQEVRLATENPSADGFRGVKTGALFNTTALRTARMNCLSSFDVALDEVAEAEAQAGSSGGGSLSGPTYSAPSAFMFFDNSPSPSR